MCIAFACVPCMRHACVVHEPCVPIPRVERARLSVHLCWWCALKRHYPAPANELLCDSVVDLGWKLVLCTLRTLRRVRYIILFLFMDLSIPHRWRDHPTRTLRKYKYQSWYCSPEHTHQVLCTRGSGQSFSGHQCTQAPEFPCRSRVAMHVADVCHAHSHLCSTVTLHKLADTIHPRLPGFATS